MTNEKMVVITKDRDNKEKPTLFFGTDGEFHSASNKKEFAAVADKIKIVYDDEVLNKLLRENAHQFDGDVKVTVEWSMVEFVARYM